MNTNAPAKGSWLTDDIGGITATAFWYGDVFRLSLVTMLDKWDDASVLDVAHAVKSAIADEHEKWLAQPGVRAMLARGVDCTQSAVQHVTHRASERGLGKSRVVQRRENAALGEWARTMGKPVGGALNPRQRARADGEDRPPIFFVYDQDEEDGKDRAIAEMNARLAEMPATERALLDCMSRGYSIRDAAKDVGLSKSSSARALSRALARLQRDVNLAHSGLRPDVPKPVLHKTADERKRYREAVMGYPNGTGGFDESGSEHVAPYDFRNPDGSPGEPNPKHGGTATYPYRIPVKPPLRPGESPWV